MTIVESAIERRIVRLQAISYHKSWFFVTNFLRLPESLLRVLNLARLSYHANEVNLVLSSNDIPKPMPVTTNLDLHHISVTNIA
jgi:hypothetical protein